MPQTQANTNERPIGNERRLATKADIWRTHEKMKRNLNAFATRFMWKATGLMVIYVIICILLLEYAVYVLGKA